MSTHFIFDMDGTIVDSMAAHTQAWFDFAQRHGKLGDAQALDGATSGKTGVEAMRTLFGVHVSLDQALALVREKEDMYRAAFAPRFQWVAGFADFAAWVKSQGIRCGLGTAGDRHNIAFVLEHLSALGMGDLFEHCVGGDEGLRGKPHPDIFLTVAQRMGVAPADCVVFEDSPAGIAAAGHAGMRAVALLTGYPSEKLAGPHVLTAVADYRALLGTDWCRRWA